MVVVYLKNGEKAPMPDANYVKLEALSDGRGMVLRVLYTIDAPPQVSRADAYEAWGVRQEA